MNGEPVSNTSWQVMLMDQRKTGSWWKRVFCGGSLIRKRFVLTAAHCLLEHGVTQSLLESEVIHVVVGTVHPQGRRPPPAQTSNILSMHTHPDYDPKTYRNDIALLYLGSRIQVGNTPNAAVKLISRPRRSEPEDVCIERPGTKLWVTGWGLLRGDPNRIRAEYLYGVQLPVVSEMDCWSRWAEKVSMLESKICAGKPDTDTCNGDSGGPAVAYDRHRGEWVLVGVTSVGNRGCRIPSLPTIFTRVRLYHDWIELTETRAKELEEDRTADTVNAE